MAPCMARPAVSARLSPVVLSASVLPAAPVPLSRSFSAELPVLPSGCWTPFAAAFRSVASCAESCVWMSAAFRSARSLTKFSEHQRFFSPLSTCIRLRMEQESLL